MFQALILDMDGTLLDTERHLIALWDAVAREKGQVFAMEDMCSTVGVTGEEARRIMHTKYPDAPHAEISQETHARFAKMREEGGIPIKTGVFELLAKAGELGLPVAVCTSTSKESARASLETSAILPHLRAAVYGGEAERGKPDPAPYLLAAERLGVEPTACLAVEDSPSGARSALAAGMTVLVVPDLIAVPGDVREKARVVESLLDAVEMLG